MKPQRVVVRINQQTVDSHWNYLWLGLLFILKNSDYMQVRSCAFTHTLAHSHNHTHTHTHTHTNSPGLYDFSMAGPSDAGGDVLVFFLLQLFYIVLCNRVRVRVMKHDHDGILMTLKSPFSSSLSLQIFLI